MKRMREKKFYKYDVTFLSNYIVFLFESADAKFQSHAHAIINFNATASFTVSKVQFKQTAKKMCIHANIESISIQLCGSYVLFFFLVTH